MSARLPASFWWLWAGTLVNSLATFIFPFLALYLTKRGFGLETTGLIVAAFGGGSIVATPLAGWLADHVGRRPTLLFSLLASASITAVVAVLKAPVAIAAGVLVLGLVASAFRPVLNAIVADIVAAEDRPRAFGLIYWAINLGMGLSLAGGGMLAAYGYEKLFLADAATTALFAALVWQRIPETRPAAPAKTSDDPPGDRGFAPVLRDAVFLAFLAVNFLFVLVFWQFQMAMPIDMARRGLGPDQFGWALAVNGFLIAAIQPIVSPHLGRVDAPRLMAVASVLVGEGYGLFAVCSTVWHYAGATAIWTVGEVLLLPVASSVVADLSPVDLRGRYQGAYGLSFGLGMLASPALGSIVMERLGRSSLWLGCLGLACVVALAHLAIAARVRRRRSGGP